MLWFWCKMLLIALGLFILITILNAVSGESASGDSGSGASKKAAGKRNYRFGEKKFRVAVQYKKEQREDGAYLYRIRPREETDLEDEIPILLDFEYDSEQFFLLRSHRKSNCIRRYDVYRSETDPIELYTLLDVDEPWKTKMLLNCVELNDYCRKHYAVSAQELPINFADDAWVRLSDGILDFSQKHASAEAASNIQSRIDDFDDFDPELADFDPDTFDPAFDEVPDGYFINEFGELEPGDDPDFDDRAPDLTSDPAFNNPNKRGSDAWWAEQEKFINESLYVNHDWDIFKREEERCDAKHCHDPYHHHKK